ncbi:MAG TPA: AEC family transporter [Methanoregulaceae archaeon]|nr:AEC family transporter [Methanoregulaceae archaeon]
MAEMISLIPVYQFVIIALLIVGIMRVLKWKGIFNDNDQPVFDKIVTELAVPAIIFTIFATYDFSLDTLYPAGILFVTLIVALVLAYIVCRFCRFPPKVTGTIVMISGFGSTATMASPLLMDLFSGQVSAIDKGLTIGTIGVAFPFFTIGVLIASYFGAKESGKEVSIAGTLKEFLATPIFISFVAGVLAAVFLVRLHMPFAEGFTDVFTHFFTIISLSLNLLIWIAIGLMLRPIKLAYFLPLFLLVIAIKLLFEPVFATYFAISAGASVLNQEMLMLESSVPSGAVAAVLASRYGCDSSLAGWMVVGTYLVSLITIPLVFFMFP